VETGLQIGANGGDCSSGDAGFIGAGGEHRVERHDRRRGELTVAAGAPPVVLNVVSCKTRSTTDEPLLPSPGLKSKTTRQMRGRRDDGAFCEEVNGQSR